MIKLGLIAVFFLAALGSPGKHAEISIAIKGQLDGVGDHGTFVLSGALSDHGRVITRPEGPTKGGHETELRTLIGRHGLIRLQLGGRASFYAVDVTWTISSGTGAYAGLHGNGIGKDTILPYARISGSLVGRVWH